MGTAPARLPAGGLPAGDLLAGLLAGPPNALDILNDFDYNKEGRNWKVSQILPIVL